MYYYIRLIPKEIINLCLKFYHIPKHKLLHLWDNRLANGLFYVNNNKIIHIYDDLKWCTAFLCNTLWKGIHKFKLKIKNSKSTICQVYIRICEINDDHDDDVVTKTLIKSNSINFTAKNS